MGDFRIVVGLGNPGERYERTRHNVGFLVVDRIYGSSVSGRKAPAWREKFGALTVQIELSGGSVMLVKPQSFMNLSGVPLQCLVRFYKVQVEEVIVAHDELDLPFGTLRIKQGGSDGGHNGLRSVTECLGSGDYARLRVGVGKPEQVPSESSGIDVSAWLLSRFNREEESALDEMVERCRLAVVELCAAGILAAQNKFNLRKPRGTV